MPPGWTSTVLQTATDCAAAPAAWQDSNYCPVLDRRNWGMRAYSLVPTNEASLDLALTNGVSEIGIYASNLQLLAGGLIPCSKDTNVQPNHAVAVVGYGTFSFGGVSKPAYIVRNSWGTGASAGRADTGACSSTVGPRLRPACAPAAVPVWQVGAWAATFTSRRAARSATGPSRCLPTPRLSRAWLPTSHRHRRLLSNQVASSKGATLQVAQRPKRCS